MNDGTTPPSSLYVARILLSFCACLMLDFVSLGMAQEEAEKNKPAVKAENVEPEQASSQPLGVYLTLTSPIDSTQRTAIRNSSLKLREQANLEKRDAVLVLEIPPGTSEFAEVYSLAKFLTSADLSNVTTIAWVPETVLGMNAMVALSCQEIVLHPDAEIGDLARGQQIDPEEVQLLASIVDKRYNRQVNEALLKGLVDPKQKVLKITFEKSDQQVESRVVSESDLKQLRNSGVVISDVQTLFEAGEVGKISGTQARNWNVLISKTAVTKNDVLDAYGLPAEILRNSRITNEESLARLIKVTDTIDPVLEAFLGRQIDRALNEGANTLIFEVDSPGGYLMSGINLAQKIADLSERDIHTIAYVPNKAISSAAILSFGCDDIFLHQEGSIGDAGVIQMNGEWQFERVPEKIVSFLRPALKELAIKKQRPPALLEAMSFKELEVFKVTHRDNGRVWYLSESEIAESNGEWIQGARVPESAPELLLTVDGQRAVDLKLATAVVSDLDELKTWLDLPPNAALKPVKRTFVDTLIYVLNDPVMTGLLLFFGIMLAYIELHFAIGLFGILSTLCFTIFFWSHYLGGSATALEIMLALLGLALIAMEIFLIPGFGVFGLTGGLLVMGSLVMATATLGQLEPGADNQSLSNGVMTLAIPILGVIATSMVIGKYLPSIPLLNVIVQLPPEHGQDSPRRPSDLNQKNHQQDYLLGKIATTVSTLRPSGKVEFEGELIEVFSNGPYIDVGKEIEFHRIEGNRIIVREVS